MKSLIPPAPPWGADAWFGATVVAALLAGMAITFWLGWPVVRGWLSAT